MNNSLVFMFPCSQECCAKKRGVGMRTPFPRHYTFDSS